MDSNTLSCIKLNNQQRQNQFYVEHDQRLRDNEDNYRQQLAEQNRLFKSRLEWATNTHRSFSDALHNDFLLSYQQSVQELATSLNGENDRLRRTIEQMRFDLDAAQQALLVITNSASFWGPSYEEPHQDAYHTTISDPQGQPTAGSSSLQGALDSEPMHPDYSAVGQEVNSASGEDVEGEQDQLEGRSPSHPV
ncbi:hypothetical protein FIBSPDRAFT_884673 [Athelia psychrophila]|uniref:Uncharacterized protein n=1 Tax=Athelia psychrophila TaxID=1759441 RepID=A0A166SMJ4_9AGAM|nr:hypothetical protein FIBSPDRAFT_884673 [Fibularhizoctonia sp. CBS 109695]